MAGGQVRVAVVGTGETGRGWATLCVGNGWPVSLYDTDSGILKGARDEVVERARGLPLLVGADADVVEAGVAGLQDGRSLLQACQEADWVIEAIHEDRTAKQKLFEGLESAAPKARVVTSSSASFTPQEIAARCRRPDRVLVVYPQHPTELIPLVEILVGPQTDGLVTELVKGWLRHMGRIPVMLKKSVQGNVAGRISAAVWREAIQLVLDGVIDVDDLDRAVSVGPGLTLASAGPHLACHLAAGQRGTSAYVQHLLCSYEETWRQLASWSQLPPADQQRLIAAIERAYAGKTEDIRRARDRRLAAMLHGLEASRKG